MSVPVRWHSLVVATVAGEGPVGQLEVLRWYVAATRLAGVSPENVVIGVAGPETSDVFQFLAADGAQVVGLPLDPGSDHTSPDARLARVLDWVSDQDLVVLTSPDVAMCADPRVELSEEVFENGAFVLSRTPLEGGARGFAVAMVGDALQGFADSDAALAHRMPFGPPPLAMGETNASSDAILLQVAPDNVGPTGLIEPRGEASVDARIAELNGALTSVFSQSFPNATFWEWRYRTNPALGSGVGSRGRALQGKRAMIRRVLRVVRPESVLDIGCGDGSAVDGLDIPGYEGLDVSSEALRLVASKRPAAVLYHGTLSDHRVTADLVMCLDVLIHTTDRAQYEDLVGRLVEAARRCLLVAGYEEVPRHSPMTKFHEPLSSTILRSEPEARLRRIRKVHGITTWLVVLPGVPISRFPWAWFDYGELVLNTMRRKTASGWRLRVRTVLAGLGQRMLR